MVALALGLFGGYWIRGAAGTNMPAGSSRDGRAQWYTCGMHPMVLQKEPGECPICGMKLTPRKSDEAQDKGGLHPRKVLYWRAPMDPNYISEQPGKSPMGMDLVPVYADEADSPSSHAIRINPITIQNMGIRTAVIGRSPLVKHIRALGRIDYDEQLVTFVDTKFNGWIEKLYVNRTGQTVERNTPLFDVYSPELYAAQREYLAALGALDQLSGSSASVQENARLLVDAARTKLSYLDVSEEQIQRLSQGDPLKKTMTIHSSARGVVTEKMALEGMYVKPGMRLYTIADLSHVWVYVDIYEYQLPWVRVGQDATMSLPYLPGREFVGQVVYIYPYLEERTRVIQVRLEFENPDMELKPGMFATVKLSADLKKDALLVPREAYIDSGTRKVVFVALGDGRFAPRDILTGVEAEDGMVEVLHGLDEGEVVVTSGQFMLDAESKLKEAVAKMQAAQRAETTKRPPPVAPTGHGADTKLPDTGYVCPMESHPDQEDPAEQGSFFSDEAGRCPWCNMALKPVADVEWVRTRRAAQGGDVAYTCADHQDIVSQEPGQCSRCGRKLSPFKLMYTCPDPEHAASISTAAGNCPQCRRGMATFRGMWLDEAMANRNVPPLPVIAQDAEFHCPIHPLVHSDRPGNCTICGSVLEGEAQIGAPMAATIPSDAKYTCSMKECWHFSAEAGECPVCGMDLKPLQEVDWVQEIRAAAVTAPDAARFVCPMHPNAIPASKAGSCPICAMRLVDRAGLSLTPAAPERVAAQMNYLMEHYLELQRLFGSDSTDGVALNALGLAAAADELGKQLDDPQLELPDSVREAVDQLRTTALKTTGATLAGDRVTFVEMSSAMRTLVTHLRPDSKRWPKLYIYHCPMSKGDWLQATEEKANPYYGFKMRTCGELQEIR